MAGLLDLSPELLKQAMLNAQLSGSKDYQNLNTGGFVPVGDNSYIQFGLSGDKSKYFTGLTGANAELGQGNNAIGVDYNKYYMPTPNVDLPEAIRSQMNFLSNQMPASLLNLYYKRQF